ncbi:putative membrane protein [Thermoplasmatales archaeon]|nr:putative membrane protein [Thermoplasmatales archaeon]
MPDNHEQTRDKFGMMIVIISIGSYAVIYSIFSVMRFLTYNAYVYDLGLSSSLLYSAVHGGVYYFIQNPASITANKMIYIPLSVIFQFYPNFIPLLVFQACWIAIGAYPLYMISRKVIVDAKLALLPPLLYLLYYPLAGVAWYDFHFMAIFPTFFFLGFWLYLSDRKATSAIVLFLAAMTNYLAVVIVLFFGLVTLLGKKGIVSARSSRIYGITLIIFSVLLLLIINMHFGAAYTATVSNVTGFPQSIFQYLSLKLFLVFALLVPLFFISLYSPKYLILSLPYFVFVFFQGSHLPYFSPINFQYPSLVIPGIFISFVYGTRKLKDISSKKSNGRRIRRIAKALIATNIILAIVLTPVGSIITGDNALYDGHSVMLYTAQDSALNAMIGHIPAGSSVMIQANMPQLTAGYNWIVPYEFNGSNYPDYAINDPYEHLFNNTQEVYLSNTSQEVTVFNEFLNSGEYAILSEQYGIILLERNWTGIAEFTPLIINHSISLTGKSGIIASKTFNWSNSFIAPGTYNVTIYLGDTTFSHLMFRASIGNATSQIYNVKNWSLGSGIYASCLLPVGTSYFLDPHFSISMDINGSGIKEGWISITQESPSL